MKINASHIGVIIQFTGLTQWVNWVNTLKLLFLNFETFLQPYSGTDFTLNFLVG